MDKIYKALREEDKQVGEDATDADDYNEELESVICKFYVSLIYYIVGSVYFRLPVISFYIIFNQIKTFKSNIYRSEVRDKIIKKKAGDNKLNKTTRRYKN